MYPRWTQKLIINLIKLDQAKDSHSIKLFFDINQHDQFNCCDPSLLPRINQSLQQMLFYDSFVYISGLLRSLFVSFVWSTLPDLIFGISIDIRIIVIVGSERIFAKTWNPSLSDQGDLLLCQYCTHITVPDPWSLSAGGFIVWFNVFFAHCHWSGFRFVPGHIKNPNVMSLRPRSHPSQSQHTEIEIIILPHKEIKIKIASNAWESSHMTLPTFTFARTFPFTGAIVLLLDVLLVLLYQSVNNCHSVRPTL